MYIKFKVGKSIIIFFFIIIIVTASTSWLLAYN